MQATLSIFSGAQSTRPNGAITFADFIDDARAGRWGVAVGAFRTARVLGDSEHAALLKKALPAVTVSGRFNARHNTGLAAYSGIIAVDIDKVGVERAEQIRDESRQDPHTLAAFVSPSCEGVKLFFTVTTGPAQHLAAWEDAAQRVRKRYGVEVDGSGKDLARLCFVSFDAGAFYNADALPLSGEANGTAPSLPVVSGNDPLHDGSDLEHLSVPMEGVTIEDARAALEHLDPDCTRPEWLEVAAALRHQFYSEPESSKAYELFDRWSSAGEKYVDSDETAKTWTSLKQTPKGRNPVTFRTVFKRAQENGWMPSKSAAEGVAAWVSAHGRTSADLREGGIKRLAESRLSRAQREEVLELLRARLVQFGVKVSAKVLRLELDEATAKRRKESPDPVPKWARHFVYVAGKHDEVYHVKRGNGSKTKAFDAYWGKVMADDMAAHKYLLNACNLPRANDYAYHPEKPLMFLDFRGVDCVNTYRHTYPKPDYEKAEKAGKLLLRHIGNLIGETEHRQTVLDFMAYQLQQPGKKVLWAPLIQGVQGCGKSTLADVMRETLGASNVRRVEASAALESPHNGYAYGSQLVAFDEVRNVGTDRFKVMEKLKPLITDAHIDVNPKNVEQRNVENVTNYILFSNHHDALAIDDQDRRFFILKSPLQSKADLEACDATQCCKELHEALKQNPGAFRAFLLNRPISLSFDPTGHAPLTAYKMEMARAAESPLKAAVREALDDAETAELRRDLFMFDALLNATRVAPGCERINSQTLAGILNEMGYVNVGRHRINGGEKRRLWALRTSPFASAEPWDVAAEFKARQSGSNTGFELLS